MHSRLSISILSIFYFSTLCLSQNENSRNICLNETVNDFKRSVQHFEKLIAQDSSDLDALHDLGMSYYKLRSYDKAITTFSLLIAKDECYLNPLSNRGLSKYLSGDKVGACEDLAQALKCKMKSKQRKSEKNQIAELCKN